MNMKTVLLTAAIICSLTAQAQSQMELTATEVATRMAPEVATGIKNIATPTTRPDDSIYNLQGQKIGGRQYAQGILIQNGKKWISR